MPKFFVQMLLSVLVAVGTAVGFSPNINREVHKTLGEAKSFTHEIRRAILSRAGSVGRDTRVSAELSTEASVESKVDKDLNFKSDNSSKKSSETRIGIPLSVESETEAEMDINNINVDLDLDVGILK